MPRLQDLALPCAHHPQRVLLFRAGNERMERGKAWFPKKWPTITGQRQMAIPAPMSEPTADMAK